MNVKYAILDVTLVLVKLGCRRLLTEGGKRQKNYGDFLWTAPYVVIIFCGKKELEIGYTKQFTRENLTFDDLFELKVI